jgi:uncharacterized phage protein gp47/JayE
MSLNLPDSAAEVVNRAKTAVLREVPGSNPFLRNSWIGAIVTGIANRVYDFYLQLKQALLQAIPDTATGDYLVRWASIWRVQRLPATVATGAVTFTGTAGSTVPAGSTLVDSTGQEYTTDGAVTVAATSVSVASITRSGSTATATTTSAHNLTSGVPVTIAGANETEYNLTGAAITVTGNDTFTYQVSGSPATPATGTITASFTAGSANVTSAELGTGANQDADAELTLQSPVVGVDNTAQVTYGKISGGTDQETDDALRSRFLSRLQNPIAQFNSGAIESKAKEVSGVTRVFVQEVTPATGQVTVYFMRDSETPAIPDASEVTTVKTKLLEILPANTQTADLIVAAPTAVPVSFTFSGLTPNTATMQTAIEDSLDQLFGEAISVGEDLTEDAYRSVVYNTIDTVTGDRLQSFILSSPTGTVTIASDEIATKGSITWP